MLSPCFSYLGLPRKCWYWCNLVQSSNESKGFVSNASTYYTWEHASTVQWTSSEKSRYRTCTGHVLTYHVWLKHSQSESNCWFHFAFYLTRRKDLFSNPWFWSWHLMPIGPAAMWGTTWLVTRPFATYRRQRVASTNSLRTLDSRDLEEMGYMDVWAIMGTIFPLLVCLAAPCFPHHLFIILNARPRHTRITTSRDSRAILDKSWNSLSIYLCGQFVVWDECQSSHWTETAVQVSQ